MDDDFYLEDDEEYTFEMTQEERFDLRADFDDLMLFNQMDPKLFSM